MKSLFLSFSLLFASSVTWSQVDTSFIYNTHTPFGTLDIRIAKSDTRYYYLDEGKTFSFRESSPGVKTNTFRDMTAWDSSPYTEGNLQEQIGDQSNFVMNYRLLKPVGYDPATANGYPLIIMFHGSGETGNCWNSNCFHSNSDYDPVVNDPPAPTNPDHELLNNDHSLLHGGSVYLKAVNLAGEKKPNDPSLDDRAFPGFVLFPQNLNGWSPGSVQDAIRIVRLLSKKYNIDQDRIYIHGLSNGGYGVYEALKRCPWMFASATVMSAVSDGFITNTQMESEISQIRLWVFQGALDNNPYPQKTRKYIERFRDAGVEVRYTEYADVGHTVWNRAYNEPDFFSWFLGHTKSEVHAFGGSPVICKDKGLLLELPEGFKAYEWQKDGVTVSGADSASFIATTPGKYRARFSRLSATPAENEWNEWSPDVEVTTQEAPVARITQIGTVLLKDLNGNGNAYLESSDVFPHYYWYKDGALLDLPGTQDDTLRTITINPGNCQAACVGNGTYTLVTAGYGNCKSEPSDAKYLFFNNQAPVNLKAATEFTGTPGAGSVELKWTDNASGELGYEIWRRAKSDQSTSSSWELVTITGPDVRSYKDEHLLPDAVYQYKIRAVASSGRSEYTPAATNVLEITTTTDTTPPSTPTNLVANRKGLERLSLSWNKSTDDVSIKEYNVHYEGGSLSTSDSTLTIENLVIDSIYHFSVTAVDHGGNESKQSNTVTAATSVNGLFYQHTPGSWTSLDSIDWNYAEYTGFVTNFSLSPKTQEDYFNFKFDGFLYINADGSYQFRIGSDDGSDLSIDNQLLIDNDGIHELKVVESNSVNLSKGAHRITVDFFEFANSDTLTVEYKGPDTGDQWQSISDEALKSNLVIATDDLHDRDFQVDIYPNPATPQELQVRITSPDQTPVTIKLLDLTGRILADQDVQAREASEGVRLNSAIKLTGGLYVIEASQGKKLTRQKVIIKE